MKKYILLIVLFYTTLHVFADGYTLIYTCHYYNNNRWVRMDDIFLNSAGTMYYGVRSFVNPSVDGAKVSFTVADGNLFDGELNVYEKSLNGWIDHVRIGRVKVKGKLFEIQYNTLPPFVSQTEQIMQREIQQPVTIPVPKPQNKPIEQDVRFNTKGFIKLYLNDDFSGESKIITESWNPTSSAERLKWHNKINSIKVSEGWAIILYPFSDYSGFGLEITDDWSAKDYPDWKNSINSIKVVRKATGRHNQHKGAGLSSGVKLYLRADFTGESKFIDSDWDPSDSAERLKWHNSINSIKVPNGWSIRLYRFSGLSGSRFIEISDDWSSDNFPDWKNEINGIKIIRKLDF